MIRIQKVFNIDKYLKVYGNADFITQLRAKFIFYLASSIIFFNLILISYRLISHPLSNITDPSHLSVLLPLTILLFVVIFILYLLLKGYYHLTSNILPLVTIGVVWLIMFLEKSTTLIRLDTIVNIFAALTMVPLLLGKRKYLILLYPAVNIVILLVFTLYVKNTAGLSNAEAEDYFVDLTTTMIFVGIVSYNIYNINRKALEKAENDVIERKNAEQALAQSERKYKEMTDLLPQIVAEIDLKGNFTYLNQAGMKRFGLTDEDIRQGVSLYSLIVEKEFIQSNIQKVLNGQRSDQMYTALSKSGEKFPIQIYSAVIHSNDEVVGFRGVVIDMSERIKVEQALRASEKKFREMTQLLPQSIYESDIKGMLTYINQAGTDMFGYSEEEVKKGLNVLDTLIPEDHERVRKSIKQIMEGGLAKGNLYTALRKNGSTFPVQIYSKRIIEDDKTVGMRGVIFDMTEWIETEQKIQQSNELFKTLVESTPVMITLTDMEGRIIQANKKFCEFVGMPLEMLLNRTPQEIGITTKTEDSITFHKQLFSKGCIENFETTIFDNKGNSIDAIGSVNLVKINNQKAILQTTLDITERKKLENQLKEYNQKLESLVQERTIELASAFKKLQITNGEIQATNIKLSEQREQLELTLRKLKEAQEQIIQTEKMASLGILTAGVAHEINNPINYIYNGAMAIENYIIENIPDHSKNLNPLIEAINTGVDRTKGIIKSLSKYSRNDTEKFSKCNIHEVMDNCLHILYNQYKNRIEVIKDYSREIPLISAFEGKLHQAFLNILTNAVQAIENSGKITISTFLNNNDIKIHIIDTGQGISAENLKYIFDPFFTTKDPGKGTGLGLSITQRIIQGHNGTINCSSQPGVGTEIIINLPTK